MEIPQGNSREEVKLRDQIDNIKMTVGLQKSTGDKVQYCITAL
mgnify:CR=1 FL=1